METSRIEILKGQDHVYWVYHNDLDKYACTDIPCSTFTPREVARMLEMVGDQLGLEWEDEMFDA